MAIPKRHQWRQKSKHQQICTICGQVKRWDGFRWGFAPVSPDAGAFLCPTVAHNLAHPLRLCAQPLTVLFC